MKTDHLNHIYFLFLCIAIAAATAQSCGGKGSDPTPATTGGNTDTPETQRVSGLLTSGVWKIQSVTVDGADQSTLFKNFAITFTASGYTVTNGGPVWPGSNTWAFLGTDATSFVRGDALLVGITAISSSAMTLSLTWAKTTYSGGRMESIAGKHVFVFGK